jgi:hypothetical protein
MLLQELLTIFFNMQEAYCCCYGEVYMHRPNPTEPAF